MVLDEDPEEVGRRYSVVRMPASAETIGFEGGAAGALDQPGKTGVWTKADNEYISKSFR